MHICKIKIMNYVLIGKELINKLLVNFVFLLESSRLNILYLGSRNQCLYNISINFLNIIFKNFYIRIRNLEHEFQ